ncbi:MAG: LamG domain-containing protein, partial [Crocinitomicaceae bacterium]
MKRFVAAVVLSVISSIAFAQSPGDTIIVQSFDWSMTALGNSGVRDMMVPFPDDPNLTYEKIILKYNMRCRDGNVNTTGGNYVACGEWDYSCNTYIHDSTKIDSVLSTTPDHLITGFSGTTFNYTSTPTYSYYRYLQQNVTLNNIVSETQSTVGTGVSTTSHTFPSNSENGKSQYLFTAAELQGAGVLTGNLDALSLNVSNAGGVTDFLRVRIKHTLNAALDDTDPDLTGFTEVYFHNTAFINGANRLQFYTPFAWDGTSNIIVEFSFTNLQSNTIIDIDGEDTGMDYGMYTAGDRNHLFDGANYIEADTYKGIDGGAARSCEAWINSTVNNKEFTSWGQNTASSKWNFRINDNGAIRVEVNGGYIIGTTLVDDGDWHHVACTFNGSDVQDVLLYVDGQLETISSSLTEPVLTNTTSGINLRLSRGTNNRYFEGIIDEVRVWSVPLSQTEIQDWMYKTVDATHPNYANLEAYYTLNEGTGAAISDATTNGNDASVINGEQWIRPHGVELFKEMNLTTERPNLTFMQGTYNLSIVNDTIYDTIQNPGNFVTEYQVVSNAGTLQSDDIAPLTSNWLWQATFNYVYDENGTLIQSIPVN